MKSETHVTLTPFSILPSTRTIAIYKMFGFAIACLWCMPALATAEGSHFLDNSTIPHAGSCHAAAKRLGGICAPNATQQQIQVRTTPNAQVALQSPDQATEATGPTTRIVDGNEVEGPTESEIAQMNLPHAFVKKAKLNQARSDTFLREAAGMPGVVSLPTGVLYQILETGTGPTPTSSSMVSLTVIGPYAWGTPPRGRRQLSQDLPPRLLSAIELPAIREILTRMPQGSKWSVTLPPNQAFGADPNSAFPPNVAVVYVLTLVEVH